MSDMQLRYIRYNFFKQEFENLILIIKMLKKSLKSTNEIEMHLKACKDCKSIAYIQDVYENFVDNENYYFIVLEL